MAKDQTNKVFEDQLASFINLLCEKRGHRMVSLYDVKIKSQKD